MKQGKLLAGQTGLATALGVTQQRVSELVREGRIPRKAKYTADDAKAAREMLTVARAGNNATAGNDDDDPEGAVERLKLNPEKLARIKFLIERTAKVKLERELLAGGYVKKTDVQAGLLARVYSIRARLAELPLRAHLLIGKTEVEIESILRDFARETCDHYANGGA